MTQSTFLEVHKGRDGRYYVIDAARLMPPEIPDKGRCIFAHCLRPTFVLDQGKALLSFLLTLHRVLHLSASVPCPSLTSTF